MSAVIDQLAHTDPGPDAERLPDWVQSLQQRGREHFAAHGFPDKRVEAWRYTPLTAFEGRFKSLRPATGESARAAQEEGRLDLGDPWVIEMVDGVIRIDEAGQREGVRVRALKQVMEDDGERLAEILEGLDFGEADQAMEALNTADLGAGIVIEVDEAVDAGTMLARITGTEAGVDTLVNLRIIIDLAPGSTLRWVEDYAVRGGHNVVSQFSLGTDCELRHARIQDNDAQSALVTFAEVRQQTDSRFVLTSLDLGTGLTRHGLRNRLMEKGAETMLRGAYFNGGDAHLDYHLDVRHEAPGCHSEQTFRGVVKDHARAVFAGRVHVLPGADDSEAHQSNANLLLSRDGEVDTKPELIIEADEVIASHGATVGQLDEKAVFYLRSRGLDDETARQMLTAAFCRSVLEAVEDEGLREAFMARLDRSLEVLT